MQSEFNKWLTDLSEIAAIHDVIIEAKYYDGLEYFFKSGLTPQEAYPRYINLMERFLAIKETFATLMNSKK